MKKKEKREILLAATGGTIVSPLRDEKAAPDAEYSHSLLDKAETYLSSAGFAVRKVLPFGEAGLDSSDIGPVQWVKLSAEIYRAMSAGFAGALITHGTDTMAYSAAWLSLCFPSAGAPIILTGSQETPDKVPFDGDANLLGAARLVSSGACYGAGVYFDWKLFDGRYVHKAHTENIDAFRSIGTAPLAYHQAMREKRAGGEAESARFAPGLEKIIALTQDEIIAGTRKAALCFALPGAGLKLYGDEEILIIAGFGAGNIPNACHKAISAAYPSSRKPCIIACSQAEDGVRKPSLYGDVGIGRLAEEGFPVYNQLYTLEYTVAAAYYSLLAPEEPELALKFFLPRSR